MLKLCISEGGDPKVRNKQGLNAMHVAAQGDQPLIIAYLQEAGMDVDEKDLKGGAPLHWAAFMGNEMSAAVLLSWDVEKDYRDSEGNTPLHLAAIVGNTRIVRNLLLKGANRHILNVKGQEPLDIAREANLRQMVEMLTEPGAFADCGLKPPVRPYKKSLITSCLYPLGFPTAVVLTMLFTIQCEPHVDVRYCFGVYLGISVLSGVLFLAAAWKDPGYLKRTESDSLFVLLQKYEPYLICADCTVWRPARSRHCQCCDRCVEKFDHHCPWLSTCIGARNLGLFYAFLLTTQLSLLICVLAGFFALTECTGEDQASFVPVHHAVKRIIGGVVGSLACVFLVPLT